MFDANKFKRIAKKHGIVVNVVERRKQISGPGRLIDFDVKQCKAVSRVKVSASRTDKENHANIYHGSSSKSGVSFKTPEKLVKEIKKYC